MKYQWITEEIIKLRAKEFELVAEPEIDTRTIQEKVLAKCEEWVYDYSHLLKMQHRRTDPQRKQMTRLVALINPSYELKRNSNESLKRSFNRAGLGKG